MERRFTVELDDLKVRLLAMGGLAKHSLHLAISAVLNFDAKAAEEVLKEEISINNLQIEMDDRVVQLLARQQLMATDLRFALAVARINNDLERVGDQAVNIAQAAQRIVQHPRVAPTVDIRWLNELAEKMLSDSLDAFERRDLQLARSVLVRDDQVDRLRDQILRELLSRMVANPKEIVPTFDYILVAKSLERVGDHATNIAEDVIYLVAGSDVRHHVHNPP